DETRDMQCKAGGRHAGRVQPNAGHLMSPIEGRLFHQHRLALADRGELPAPSQPAGVTLALRTEQVSRQDASAPRWSAAPSIKTPATPDVVCLVNAQPSQVVALALALSKRELAV